MMMKLSVVVLLASGASLASLAACQGSAVFTEPETPGPLGEAGQPRLHDGGPTPIDPLKPPPDLGSCGGQTVPITLVQKGDIPDLFLVVDRSFSMVLPVNVFNWQAGTKWDVMRNTLNSLVDSYKVNIRFGLSVFPSDDGCGPGNINVPLQTNNWSTIKQTTLGTGPGGNTPTHTTLAAVRTYLVTQPPGKGPRYVLLATDGMPNCADDGTGEGDTSAETLAEVNELAALGIKTFVVGFGDVVVANPGLLNQLARAGGVPNPGPQAFFAATNEAELKQAMFGIAGGIIPPPCTYALSGKPPDPDKVTVTFDGKAVPRSKSSTAGWNYTGNSSEITFFGPACDQLRKGAVKEVKFIFGCKGPVIE